MGGYGSGGHNKTHKRLENFRRIDSFAFRDFIMWDKYLLFKESVKYSLVRGDIIYYPQSMEAEIREGDSYIDLLLSSVPGIDGISERLYFHCPYCGRRVRYLYDYYKHYACRKCAKLNYASQQRNGMDELRLKMERIAERLEYQWWRKGFDCIADVYYIPKPHYMRWAKYEKLMQEFRALKKEYERNMENALMKAYKALCR